MRIGDDVPLTPLFPGRGGGPAGGGKPRHYDDLFIIDNLFTLVS
jgi:hypothetical protein